MTCASRRRSTNTSVAHASRVFGVPVGQHPVYQGRVSITSVLTLHVDAETKKVYQPGVYNILLMLLGIASLQQVRRGIPSKWT